MFTILDNALEAWAWSLKSLWHQGELRDEFAFSDSHTYPMGLRVEHGGPLLPHFKDEDPEAQRQTMIHLCHMEGGCVIVF